MSAEPVPSSPPPGVLEAPISVGAADLTDIPAIFELIAAASLTTTVLSRSRESIEGQLGQFRVARSGTAVVGCGALGLFTRHLAEIKSLVVAPEMRGQGVGGMLIAALVDLARQQGVRRVFALTDNVNFFKRSGFSEVSKATLPHKVWNECIKCPKFLNCEEDAVELWLAPEESA